MVLPLYDEAPWKRAQRPYLTWGLIALNVAIFLVEIVLDVPVREAMIASLGVSPAAVVHYAPQPGPLPAEATLVTYMFLHGGWEHLFANMIYLWVFGDNIEDTLGKPRFLAFYLLSGIAAALAHVLLDTRSTIPLIGASGAVSGILAAYLMVHPCAKVSVLVLRVVVRVRAYWVIGGWVLLQLVLLASEKDDNVAYLAHIGGLVAGVGLFLILRPPGVKLFQCVEQSDDPAHPA